MAPFTQNSTPSPRKPKKPRRPKPNPVPEAFRLAPSLALDPNVELTATPLSAGQNRLAFPRRTLQLHNAILTAAHRRSS